MIAPNFAFKPKIIESLKNYNSKDFLNDISAGITVGVVALPLAMAFAIASGLKPEAGIFTAIIAGFIISAFGGSKVQIGGPAGAFIVIVYGIVAKYGVDGLVISTIMAGMLMLLMGLFQFGSLIKFVPVSIVIGFTNGIAVLIALSQIKELLGLAIEKMPANFFEQIMIIAKNLYTTSYITALVSLLTIAIILGWQKITTLSKLGFLQRIPGSIIALTFCTICVTLLKLPVETIGTKFGEIPSGLPSIVWPQINLSTIESLIPPTITIALLGAIESLLCARVADGLSGDKHNPNQELLAQGLANITAPLLGGFCATGTIARTVTNIRSGAKSPIAGIVHSLTLLVIILVAAPLAKNIPLATLGAILLFVAYNMGEWHEFVRMRHFSNNYRVILLTTFILTVTIDLTVAVEVGILLSCLFFITRISSLTRLDPLPEIEAMGHAKIGGEIEAYNLSGSLFFGAVHKLEELVEPNRATPKVLILNISGLLNIDSSGLEILENLYQKLKAKNCRFVLVGVFGQPLSLLKRAGFLNEIGGGNIHSTMPLALDYAAKIIKQPHSAAEEIYE